MNVWCVLAGARERADFDLLQSDLPGYGRAHLGVVEVEPGAVGRRFPLDQRGLRGLFGGHRRIVARARDASVAAMAPRAWPRFAS